MELGERAATLTAGPERLAGRGVALARVSADAGVPIAEVTRGIGPRRSRSFNMVTADFSNPCFRGFFTSIRSVNGLPPPTQSREVMSGLGDPLDPALFTHLVATTRALAAAFHPAGNLDARYDRLAGNAQSRLSDYALAGAMGCVPQAIVAHRALAELGHPTTMVLGDVKTPAMRGPGTHAFLVLETPTGTFIYDPMTPVTDSTSGQIFPNVLRTERGFLDRVRNRTSMMPAQSIYFPEIVHQYGVSR